MYKPNESRPDSQPDRSKKLGKGLAILTGVALIAATGLLLLRPPGAAAGVAAGTDDRVVSQASPPAPAPSLKAPATYQLRCWQYGRLLFDEGPVTLGAEARQGARLVATDRRGASLIVTDAGGTTCLARPSAAAPNLALPR